ncbi:MAG: diguanylate cyclase [Sulfurovum sp.]|nr:diguanylate cyclase [Sulfurovum sp.]
MQKPTPKELIVPSFSFDNNDNAVLHIKNLLLNAVFFITFVVSFIFFIINTCLVFNNTLAFFDIAIAAVMLYALYLLHYKNNYQFAGYIGAVTHFIIFTLIVLTQKGQHFTLIWTYFYAPFAMVTLGAKRGLVVSILFLGIIFAITATGIDTWNQGTWDATAYFRFVLAHLVMLYVMYTIFYANEKANERIEFLRQNEKKQFKLLEELTLTDPLTGLRNRRSLEERFTEQLVHARKEGKQFAFFLLDVDLFKTFNDKYGHQQGDELLVKIAQAMMQCIEQKDLFRMGGDEFAGILLDNTEEELKDKLAALRRKIASLQINYEACDIEPHATVSIGAHMVKNENETFKGIYNHADIALYQAKAQGRDQIVFH